MEFCFLTGGLLLGLFFADRASSWSVFQLAGPPARFVADRHLPALFSCRQAHLLGSWRTGIFLLFFSVGGPACLIFLQTGHHLTLFFSRQILFLRRMEI